MKVGIYKITNPEGEIYIGKSINIFKRWEHYKGFHHKTQPLLFNSFKKYGWVNHKFEILEECSKSLLTERERYYIKLYNVVEEGLNYDLTGKTGPKRGSMKGVPKISPEGKKIKSEKMKKLWAEGKVKGRNSKPFIDVSTNIRYNNITECVTSLKISSGTFYKRLKKGEFKYI